MSDLQPIKECPECHAAHWDAAGCDNCGYRVRTIEEVFADMAKRHNELLKHKTRKG